MSLLAVHIGHRWSECAAGSLAIAAADGQMAFATGLKCAS